jgi:CubicO group peptidase (beta-lactamase class C family)
MDRRRVLLGLAATGAGGGCTGGHVGRMVSLQQPDIEDYKRLPRRRVAATAAPRPLPVALDADWQSRIGLNHAGRDLRARDALDTLLAKTQTTAFVILADGAVADARFFHGYQSSSLCKSFSISKSVLSALFAIARGDGLIHEEDTVAKHLPDMAGQRIGDISLLDLLSCTAGFAYQRGVAPWHDQPTMYYTRDVRALVRKAKVESLPGRAFVEEDYSPLLLGVVLEAALRKRDRAETLAAFTARRLWAPLGAENDAYWVTDREGGGIEKTESGFVATASDLTRFGQLFLDGGIAGQATIVPKDWVEQCASPPPMGAPNLFTDGYMRHFWWGKAKGDGRYDFFANGHFGQRIYVAPDKRLVLVRLGASRGGEDWTNFLMQIARLWHSA